MSKIEYENRQFLKKLKDSTLANEFPSYKRMLNDLENRYNKFKTEKESKIVRLLPNVRREKSAQRSLTTLIGEYFESPWRKEKFFVFLNKPASAHSRGCVWGFPRTEPQT